MTYPSYDEMTYCRNGEMEDTLPFYDDITNLSHCY